MLAALALLVLPHAQQAASVNLDAFLPLTIYSGAWRVTAQHPFSGGKGPDTLINHCRLDGNSYLCDQNVNGSVAAHVRFLPQPTPGDYMTQTALADGTPAGGGTLHIDGAHWTFLSTTTHDGITTTTRVENTFTGEDAIHFDISQSTDGKHFSSVNSGDDVRLSR